jgi:hypothetical protein
MSVPEARSAALKAKSEVQHGEDPHRTRMLQVGEAVISRAKEKLTIAAALARYRAAMLDEPTPYKRTEVSQAAKAAGDIMALKGGSGVEKAAVEAIDLSALKRWSRTLPERNAKAKLRWGAIFRFLEWCVDEDLIEANPRVLVPKARRPAAPNPRDNLADAAVVAAVWRAAEKEPWPSLADLVRFLCLERQLAVARRKWRSMFAKKRKAVANAVAGIRCTPAPRPEAVSGALRMLNDYACKLPSHERLPCILPLIATAQPAIFWAGLLAQWSSCDATWSLRDELLAALIAQSRREIAERYFDDAARFSSRYPRP